MMHPDTFPRAILTWILLLLVALATAACGSGESTDPLPNTGVPTTSTNYTGPPPATEDVANFLRTVWDGLVPTNRCGGCHSTGGQSPQFVHDEDINIAFAQVNPFINLDDPARSRLVTKVAGGHNCWLSSDSACADTITRLIENWAGGSAGSATQVELRAPELRDPGTTKVFPESSSGFASSVYPILVDYCSECHVEGDQSPFFASSDVEVAYQAAQSKIDLTTPANSRLVVRLRDEFHNCWGGDCAAAADTMQAAIESFSSTIEATELDPDLVTSKALSLLQDGLLANAGGRFETNVIALYEFKTGEGVTAFDTSGVEPAMHLTLSGNVDWFGGWGITFGPATMDEETGAAIPAGKAQASTSTSRKLRDLITASGEYSIEAWVVPANITQEEARIISYSGSAEARNFSVSQTLQNYEILQRSSTTDQNTPFATADADERVQATLQHLVVNFTPSEGRRIYVNGEFTGDMDPQPPGSLGGWDDSFAFVLGNETDGNSLWEGSLRLVAVHNRALTPEQIQANFEAGVGQKFFLLFGVSHLIDIPEAFVVFRVSQFDSYSYLFSEPFFISLDETQEPGGIPLQGMRIGINGKEVTVGQAFANLDLTLNAEDYEPGSGQSLSPLGTVIALEQGPELDEFFLTFERLGDQTNVRVEQALPPASTPADLDPVPDIGLKTFAEINASMSAMTGVPTTEPAVASTFETVRQQLPVVETIEGFLSSQQMAITQLAIQYCDALVNDSTLRSGFFPGFDFNASVTTAFDSNDRDIIVDSLLTNMVGQNLATEPTDTSIRNEINNLIDRLTACAGSCEAGRTATVVKASCAAVLGSATTLLQ